MDDQIQPDDPRYLERVLAHLEQHLIRVSERQQRNHDDLESFKKLLVEVATKGDIIEISRAVRILDQRQTDSWRLLKNNAARLAYISGIAAAAFGVLVKNAGLRELLPF